MAGEKWALNPHQAVDFLQCPLPVPVKFSGSKKTWIILRSSIKHCERSEMDSDPDFVGSGGWREGP